MNSKGPNAKTGWFEFFEKAFEALKAMFREIYPFAEDGEVSADILALRDAIFKLPCPIKVLELRFDGTKFAHVKEGVGFLLRYELSKIGVKLIEDYGVVGVENMDALKTLLEDKFCLSESEITNFTSDFTTIGMSDDKLEYYIHFANYDIWNYFDRYLHDLRLIFLTFIQSQLIQKFKREIDFNTMYSLKEDQILPFEVFLKKEPILDNISGKSTIEDLQKDICTLQLIPTVPDEVKKIFKAAKNLYFFGYFQYYFFTISEHYAYLAIESALRHKYNQWIGDKAVLTCNYKKIHLRHEMLNPSYLRIFDFCSKKKNQHWNYHKLKVNDEDFPWRNELLLNWLLSKGFITRWQRDRLNLALQLRNALSHLEFVTILYPSISGLKLAAELINNLYHHNL